MRCGPIVTLLGAASSLAACNDRVQDPSVERAWIRLPAVPGQPAAAYFDLIGGGSNGAGERLVGIRSPAAERIELHESMAGMGGMSSMKPLSEVAVPPRATIRFAPGGKHAMAYGLDKSVARGTTVTLRFAFAGGKVAEAPAKAVAAGDDAPY